jgi:sulfate adenylyltransferase subunit 1 (EFTu-like GTPase family)
VIPGSALRGDMVVRRGPGNENRLGWFEGPALLERLESLEAGVDRAAAGPFRLPVQLVSRPQGGAARAYLGRVESGAVAVGDEVLVLPAGRRSRVREIVVQGAASDVAAAGDSVSIVLADDIDVARGDFIVDAAAPPREARLLEATLVWFDADPMRPGARYILQQGSRRASGRISEVTARRDVHTLAESAGDGPVGVNDIVRATLALQSPLFVDPYEEVRATGAFIVIDEATNRTVAAGLAQ